MRDAAGHPASSQDITGHLLGWVLPAAHTPEPDDPPPRYDLPTAERPLRRIAAQMNNDGTATSNSDAFPPGPMPPPHHRDLARRRAHGWARGRIAWEIVLQPVDGLAAGIAAGLTAGIVYP